MNVIQTIQLPTPNRGIADYIISQDAKGFFAHELGELTQWAKVFKTGERKAHRLNPSVRRGNQYGTFFKPKAFTTFEQAKEAVINDSCKTIIR